ncbi:MAG TPA: SpoIIE family protein phosphatase [Thermoanaerobaculia bacterium]|nr:SpoIIE family protein phosphatase [Thermoanaerobaculia bacterium]
MPRPRPRLPIDDAPGPPPKRGRAGSLWLVWLSTLVVLILINRFGDALRKSGVPTLLIILITFTAALGFTALCMYGFAVFVRWAMRKLFWRVGRRLFLSYVMLGVFPFFLFAILLMTIAYMVAGVMTHAALRGERQAFLGGMEAATREYGTTGHRPADALKSLEIYDTAAPSGTQLPDWLKATTYSGMAWRDDVPLLIAAKQFPGETPRTVVFVQPMNDEWIAQIEDHSGMTVRVGTTRKGRRPTQKGGVHVDIDDDDTGDLILRSALRKIVWFDTTTIARWETGTDDSAHELVTTIINPYQNLFHYYFGASADKYVSALSTFIMGITVLLLLLYMVAALFAAVLIFSITRAVNRIEKGTKAVERGDFSYRIGMKPRNQLGEMARSFDRMTESIASLLASVAEQERLQSEIEIAASIQRNLLPKEGPQFRGVSFSAHFEPTASIGGDYYDVFNLDKTRLAVAIGDVSGHGLSTGLVMAMVKAAITTLVEEGADETSLFHRLNDLVYRSTERRAFMTLAFTIFDLERGKIRHTNAGHLYPYLLRAGGPPIAIEVPSLPLGVRGDIRTHTEEVDLQEGDAVVYLSDGIVEAQDENGEPFGFDQLEALLAAATDRSPSAIRDTILTAVSRHSGTRPADDDRTVMVLRFEQLKAEGRKQKAEIEEALAVG